MRNIFLILSVIMPISLFASEGDDGFIPTQDDFNKMNRQKEYFETKIELMNARQAVFDAQTKSSGGIVGGGTNQSMSAECNNRAARGSGTLPSYCLNSKGDKINVEEKPPTAFVSNISGSSGNYSAELVWGDRTLSLKKGDEIVGGKFKVELVTTDDVVLRSANGVVRLGMIPVDVNSIMMQK